MPARPRDGGIRRLQERHGAASRCANAVALIDSAGALAPGTKSPRPTRAAPMFRCSRSSRSCLPAGRCSSGSDWATSSCCCPNGRRVGGIIPDWQEFRVCSCCIPCNQVFRGQCSRPATARLSSQASSRSSPAGTHRRYSFSSERRQFIAVPVVCRKTPSAASASTAASASGCD